MSESPQLPERIERELEEALRQGGVDKLSSYRRRRKRRSLHLSVPDPRPRNPGELVLMAAGLFLAWYLLPFSFRSYLLLASIAFVVIAVVTYFMMPQGRAPKYWRGRYVDLPAQQWQERLYRMIYRAR